MYPRNIIINDVTAKWAKIFGEAPQNQFGGKAWEMQIQTTDANKAKELADAGLKVKEEVENGTKVFSVNLKRKGIKADGNPMTPVKVVDANLAELPAGKRIGNGSKVNVNIWQSEYDFMGRKGISHSLTGVQVIEMIEYNAPVSSGFSAVSKQSEMKLEDGSKSPF